MDYAQKWYKEAAEAMKSTPKGQQIPQTVGNLQAIMARDAVLIQEQEATIGALRANNNKLKQKLASRLKQIAQLQARLESEEAHYARLVEQYRRLESEAIEIVDYADFPRPMKKDMDRIQKKSVDALRALIKREAK